MVRGSKGVGDFEKAYISCNPPGEIENIASAMDVA